MLWEEAVHMCERVQKNKETKGSTKSPFEIFYGEKSKIIGLFSYFGRIAYVTKRENIKKQMKDKTYKPIVVGRTDNNTRDTYNLYKPEIKRVVMSRGIQ